MGNKLKKKKKLNSNNFMQKYDQSETLEENKEKNYSKKEIQFNGNQLKFLKNIVNDSFAKFTKRNTFCVFNSFNDIFYLIYINKINSIIFYDIIDNKKIVEIKKSHNHNITNIRHCADNNNRRDLIITISLEDNNLKLWNINNYECILNLENINKNGRLFSACFLNENNLIYIITSSNYESEPTKVYDLEGKMVKIINDSNESINFIDIFYEIKNSKIYILACGKDSVISYDYIEGKIYHIYKDQKKQKQMII